MKNYVLLLSCCAIFSFTGCGDSAACGDGVNDSGEQCDDGNTASGDGCSDVCEVEVPAQCPAPSMMCGNICINPASDQANCGACDTACTAGEICDGAGSCQLSCQTGLVVCNGICVDPNTDRAFCGAGADCAQNPGVACADGEICDGVGVCALSCQLGLVDCNGTCIDPNSNPTFCGATTCADDATDGVICGVGEACLNATCRQTI